MTGIADITIVDSNSVEATEVASGLERTLCSPAVCGSETLTVYRRTIPVDRNFDLQADDNYHVVYIMEKTREGSVSFNGRSHTAALGAGVLLAPGESAQFSAAGNSMELLHMVVPKPPAAVEAGLPGGPGYFFSRETLPKLSDPSGGRVRRFCAESSVRLRDGSRLTPTNAIQAGEMHYVAGGGSPYHAHVGTDANPAGPDHCYMTFKGRGTMEVEGSEREIEPGTLVFLPSGVPHRLSSLDGPLEYFEIQAWRSFKTRILSEESMGLRWFYEPETPGGDPREWNQS